MSDVKNLNIVNAYNAPDEYTPPIQSADALFHFVEKLEYLLPILERFALVPRYCIEDINYLDINLRKIAYPMLCFCDINLHKMQDHIHFYGGDGYGIAFAKKWGIDKAIQPIQYINPNSPLKNDFSSAFLDSVKSNTDSMAKDFLLTQMLFFKPIEGTMDRNNKSIHRNFTDECEWRYVPDLSNTNLPQVIRENDLFGRTTLNKALEHADSSWIKFQPDDVKYIILKTREDFEKLINVLNAKGLDGMTVNTLISKTIIWQEEKGDF